MQTKREDFMSITDERRQELIKEYQQDANDTGSVYVQVAVLTDRIKNLTEHLKEHKKDYSARRGLLILVGQRTSLLRYLKKRNFDDYKNLIGRLGLRK